MSVVAQLNLIAKPGYLLDLQAYLKEILPGTRSFSGCLGADVYHSADDKSEIIVWERWESVDHRKRYAAWRLETGVSAALRELTSPPPSVTYLLPAP